MKEIRPANTQIEVIFSIQKTNRKGQIKVKLTILVKMVVFRLTKVTVIKCVTIDVSRMC